MSKHAFPQSKQAGDYALSEGGMTMRQYYAAHSGISVIDANESLHQQAAELPFKRDPEEPFPMDQLIAEKVRLSFLYADEMVKAGL